ncbi:MAG TPA: 50S ribosomal protein L9 [Candidatus Anoxymicrobiaceae bacterium]
MKVLLKQNIERVGRMGEIVEVAGGYGRNYLIPRGLAVGVTRGTVKDIAEQKKVLEVKAERQREQVKSVAEKIVSKPVVITARCSASGKLFGSVTNRQVADAIAQAAGEEIDRHKIHIDDRIRSVGTYKALIKLHPDVEIEMEFEVAGEGFVAEEPPEEEAETAAKAAPETATEATADVETAAEPEPSEASGEPALEAGEETVEQSEQG